MREMKESGALWIGAIPRTWTIERLRFLSKVTTGNRDTCDRVENGQYPFFVRSPKIERINSYSFDGESILMAGDGVGAGKVFHYIHGKFDCHQRVYNIHSFVNINGKFLFYYLSNNFQKEIEQSNAKSTVDSVRLPMIQNFPIAKPSLMSQKTIVNFLDEKTAKIDATIEREKQHIEKLKEYRQTLISEAVTKGLNSSVGMRDSGISWIGLVPNHWETQRLRSFCNFQNGISAASDFFLKGSPFLSYSDVFNNTETPSVVKGVADSSIEQQKLYSVCSGDLFFTRTSETIEDIGTSCVCLETIAEAVFSGFIIRARPYKLVVLPSFSKFYFRSLAVRKHFVQQTNLVTRASLSQTLLKNTPVLLPPLREQEQISAFLDKKTLQIDSVIAKKEVLISKLQEYKKSLIYETVTGKIDIPENA